MLFKLQELPFAILCLVTMPLRWTKKGFDDLNIPQKAKVMWDTLIRAGNQIDELHTANSRLEKELTAWNIFGAHAQRIIEEFAISKSDRDYAKDYPFGFPETAEQTKLRHDRAVNAAMKEAARHCYFVLPGHKFGTLSQGALALKDVIRTPTKDLRTFVNEIEEEGERLCGSKEKYYKANQRAFIRDFPDRVSVKHRDL